MNPNRYPILKLLLPLMAGIFFTIQCNFNSINYLSITILLLFCLLSSAIFRSLDNKTFHHLALFLLCSSAFLFAVVVTQLNLVPPHLEQTQKIIKNAHFFTAQIQEPPSKKDKSVKIIANVLADSAGNTINVSAVLYLQMSPHALNLKSGDIICFHTDLKLIDSPKNPYSFDNRKYLQKKHIFFTSYLSSSQWTFLSESNDQPLRRLARNLQQQFSKVFADNGLSGSEYSIITAILLGNSETMTADLRSSYASAGVSHILCVSGMHVGIIFMIVNFLLKPLDYSQRARWLKAVLLMLLIWSYATLTGLSPSVKRAATMFTFVTIGGLLRRPIHVFHSLFASLFILLIFNPLLLFEVGFQMSYLAVFGIVIVQPKIKALYVPKTRIVNYFWELAAVSIAAQLTTFPLSIYYFGQFPNYFLLANLSVIALSFVIVVSGVILLIFCWLPVISSVIGKVLVGEIKLLNGIVKGIDSLPGAVTENISITSFHVILLYLIIITALIYFSNKSLIPKYLALGSMLVYGLSLDYTRIQESNIQEITFYSLNRQSAVGFNSHAHGMVLLDSIALTTPLSYDYNVKPHARAQHIKNDIQSLDKQYITSDFVVKIADFVRAGDKTIYFLNGQRWLYPPNQPYPVDILCLQNNPKIPMYKLLAIFTPRQLVVDSSNSDYWASRWADSCAKYQIPCHLTNHDGYFSLKN